MERSKIAARACTIRLEAGVKRVFPLFDPVKEKEWAEGWNFRMLSPDTDYVGERMVFQTASGHPEDPIPATWIVSKYDPDKAFIEYTVFTQTRVWWISIKCHEEENGTVTNAIIEYTYLGWNEEANLQNQEALDGMFRHDLRDWEAAINHYLRTGTLLRHNHLGHHGHK